MRAASGERRLPAADLFIPPMTDVRRMHALEAREILTGVHLPTAPARRSHFVKIAVRGVWDFALASAAPRGPIVPTGKTVVLARGFSLLELERAGLSAADAERLGIPVEADRNSMIGANVMQLMRLHAG